MILSEAKKQAQYLGDKENKDPKLEPLRTPISNLCNANFELIPLALNIATSVAGASANGVSSTSSDTKIQPLESTIHLDRTPSSLRMDLQEDAKNIFSNSFCFYFMYQQQKNEVLRTSLCVAAHAQFMQFKSQIKSFFFFFYVKLFSSDERQDIEKCSTSANVQDNWNEDNWFSCDLTHVSQLPPITRKAKCCPIFNCDKKFKTLKRLLSTLINTND
ncbi:hypothetical protein RFI_19711 [Reticulomyxa filosa]|uniref:Uncharacterized protein n=1 Tax=Reticulomyxa filosa TaxID=46433 RepID=X6MUU0_RETFI|nr:hypothetical protein RFI_19711 [Reticulomyxa filosa]|eukprot:ETO17609.1 hypothetical protein RFI_19711 [Reticulomyxa filosa]